MAQEYILRNDVKLTMIRDEFSRLLAAEVCATAVIMKDTPSSGVVWRVLGTHSIRQFHLYFPSRASPCAITFQLDSTKCIIIWWNVCAECAKHLTETSAIPDSRELLTSEGSWQTFLAHARQSQPMGPDGQFVSQRTGSHSAGISCTIHELFCL
jgi:hypothetical protein